MLTANGLSYTQSNCEPKHHVILNLVQDLSEDWEIKARGEMLKRVQHDNTRSQKPTPSNVILNSFQDLSAEKDKKRLAVRC